MLRVVESRLHADAYYFNGLHDEVADDQVTGEGDSADSNALKNLLEYPGGAVAQDTGGRCDLGLTLGLACIQG